MSILRGKYHSWELLECVLNPIAASRSSWKISAWTNRHKYMDFQELPGVACNFWLGFIHYSLGYFLILTVIVQRYVYIISKLFITTILLIPR